MKRDLELVRKLLFAVEESPSGFVNGDLSIEGYSDEQIGYHAYLLVDAGLAEGSDVTHHQSAGPEYRIRHLTYAGHDFADAARNETIWKKARSQVSKIGGSISLDLLKELLVKLARDAVAS